MRPWEKGVNRLCLLLILLGLLCLSIPIIANTSHPVLSENPYSDLEEPKETFESPSESSESSDSSVSADAEAPSVPRDGEPPTGFFENTSSDDSSAPSVAAPEVETPNETATGFFEPQSTEPAPVEKEAAQPAPARSKPVRTVKAKAASATKQYSVWIWQENGDCLWRIAEKMYGDRHRWKEIYLANKDILDDPHHIYPKQKLKIPVDN